MRRTIASRLGKSSILVCHGRGGGAMAGWLGALARPTRPWHTKLSCVAGLLAITVSAAAFAAEPEPTFRWRRAISLPALTATTLVAAPLDTHVYGNTREDWPDVRLRTASGTATAFVIRPAMNVRDQTVREFWPAKQTAAKLDGDHGLQVELMLSKDDPTPTGLKIVSPLRDFEHQVQVESSADGVAWEPAGEPTLIFDYTRFVDARNDTVSITPSAHRQFRLTIADVTAEQESQLLELHRRLRGDEEADRTERTVIARRPFRIDRVEFFRDVARPQSSEPRTLDFPVSRLTTTPSEGGARTVVTLGTDGEPLTALRIDTPSENFSRVVNVETEVDLGTGATAWKPFAPGTLTKFAVGTLHREDLTIPVPQTRRSNFRLVIENDDSPPLTIENVIASGPVYELLFLATPNERYTVEYGHDDATSGRYDTAALAAALNDRQPATEVRFGDPQLNPNAPTVRRPAWKPWNDPRVLIGGILLMAAILAIALYAAGKELKVTDENAAKPQEP
jgi:hypothetical protein